MLRTFKHTTSKFYKLNSFVNHLFLDVVFRADKIGQEEFSEALIMPKYKALIAVNAEYILNPIKEIYTICRKLSPAQLKLLRRGVHNNSKIRRLCKGEIAPMEYEDIRKLNSDLVKPLKDFFNFLYDDVIGLAIVRNNYEDVSNYYKKLVGSSLTCKCCGVGKILNKFHSKRSALDHILPRNHYPFISINCNNLIPICETCNSKYKLSQNTLFDIESRRNRIISKTRRKVFYPYSRINPDIKIKIVFNQEYSPNILPEDIDISFEYTGYEEELKTWNALFGIEENYKAELCSEDMLMYLEEQRMASTYGLNIDNYINVLKANDTFYNKVFLRIGLLEAINVYP